jgi:hypothetical protein
MNIAQDLAPANDDACDQEYMTAMAMLCHDVGWIDLLHISRRRQIGIATALLKTLINHATKYNTRTQPQ